MTLSFWTPKSVWHAGSRHGLTDVLNIATHNEKNMKQEG